MKFNIQSAHPTNLLCAELGSSHNKVQSKKSEDVGDLIYSRFSPNLSKVSPSVPDPNI